MKKHFTTIWTAVTVVTAVHILVNLIYIYFGGQPYFSLAMNLTTAGMCVFGWGQTMRMRS